jgi:glycosyltransferase involved in cell wall biosynthesis/tetratricopeptide (TPR) repeat protein
MFKKNLSLLGRLSGGPTLDKPVKAPDEVTVIDAVTLVGAATEAQSGRDWARAELLWSAACEQRPREINCWLQLGNMRNELGQYESALSAFEIARGLDSQAVEPLIGIAGVQERAGVWQTALDSWNKTIGLLEDSDRRPRSSDAEWLGHAFRHAALSASMAGHRELSWELMLDGTLRVRGFADHPSNLLLRAQMIRSSNPQRALLLLRQCLERTPDEDAACFELGSVALESGDAVEGAEAVEAALVRRGSDISFLWLLADLRDRLRDWRAVCTLSQRMATLAPADSRYLRRALDAALAMKDLVTARRVACMLLRTFPDELAPLHDLALAYESAEEFDRARLLFRFLRKHWPHSNWHAARVIILTATRRSLSEAERLLRAEINTRGQDIEFDRAYYSIAFRSGNYAEARRRLEWFIGKHQDDNSAQILLGYVIANTTGVLDGERQFQDIATRNFQIKDALIGLAHMAMRRRESFIAHERWGNIVELYPDDTIARVEFARSAYEIREFDLALMICEKQLRLRPTDVTMGEFYAWLLAAIGRFESAWNYLKSLRLHAGATWTVFELSLLSAAQSNRLVDDFKDILVSMPAGTSRGDGRGLYRAIRQLWSERRTNLLYPLLSRAAVEPKFLPWLSPYLRESPTDSSISSTFLAAVNTSWTATQNLVRGDIAARLSAASDAEIATILDRPKHTLSPVHIVNKFEQMRGGSELHAVDLAERLRKHTEVDLWAPEMPHPYFSDALGVKAMDPSQGQVPHGGALVIIGVYFDIATWIGRVRPLRVIFLYNTFEAPRLFERIRDVYERTGVRSELLFCSHMMGKEVDLPGFFEPSPLDIGMFRPRSVPFLPSHRFSVGRHSRDVVEKHHSEDWKVYAAVAQADGVSRLLGGTCMQRVFPKVESIEFLPARVDGVVEFLQELDCYYYNTSTWIEPWGRVVIEAMACGLPVLVSDSGGYAQVIEHGRNGLLFRSVDEAVDLMRTISTDPALRRRLGAEARRSVETLLGESSIARLVAFYLAKD